VCVCVCVCVCVPGVQAQPSVTFSTQSFCVVAESSVKIRCTFTKPDHSNVTQREWYRVQSSEGEPQDLSKDPQYSGRLQFWPSDCALTVNNVSVSDSGVYNFRFKTQSSDWISAPSGVHLTVTDLQVKVDPNTVGQREVKLTCSFTCSLSPYIFHWYKNGKFFKNTNDNYIVLESTSLHDEGSYSCKAYESERRSSP
ncbi:B-cell receptor CD22-like, partial [Silurus asotus]